MITGEINIFPERFQSLESVLLASQVCYEKALSFDPEAKDRENLLKRLGNIHNELGVLYMNQVSCKYKSLFSIIYTGLTHVNLLK